MRYPEIAELTCMSLFQYLPYASEKAFEWMADDREYFQLLYCSLPLFWNDRRQSAVPAFRF